jgi:hypothetical protein
MVPPDRLLSIAAKQIGVRTVAIGDRWVPFSVVRRVPREIMIRRLVFPLELVATGRKMRLVTAFAALDDLRVVDEVAFAADIPVEPVLASEDDIACALARHGITGPERKDLGPIDLPPEPDEPMEIVSRVLSGAA